MRWPFTRIRPSSIFSRWLRQRIRVVLPEPEAPTMTTTSPRRTVSVTPLRTSSWPNDLWTSVASTTVSTVEAGRPPIAERMDAAMVLTVLLQTFGPQPLQPFGEEPAGSRLAPGRLAEAPLDPLLHEAPE